MVSPALIEGCNIPAAAPSSAPPPMVFAPGTIAVGANIAKLPATFPTVPAVVFISGESNARASRTSSRLTAPTS
jgi:hypothetical protein